MNRPELSTHKQKPRSLSQRVLRATELMLIAGTLVGCTPTNAPISYGTESVLPYSPDNPTTCTAVKIEEAFMFGGGNSRRINDVVEEAIFPSESTSSPEGIMIGGQRELQLTVNGSIQREIHYFDKPGFFIYWPPQISYYLELFGQRMRIDWPRLPQIRRIDCQ
jgi:hypothetical protein